MDLGTNDPYNYLLCHSEEEEEEGEEKEGEEEGGLEADKENIIWNKKLKIF